MIKKILGPLFGESEFQRQMEEAKQTIANSENKEREQQEREQAERRRLQNLEHEKNGELYQGERLTLLAPMDEQRSLHCGDFFTFETHTSWGGPECKYLKNDDSVFVARSEAAGDGEPQSERIFFGVVDGAGGSRYGQETSIILADRLAHYFSHGRKEEIGSKSVTLEALSKNTMVSKQELTLLGGGLATTTDSFSNDSLEDRLHKGLESADDSAWSRFVTQGYGCVVVCGVDMEKQEILLANIGDTRGIVVVEKENGEVEMILRTELQNEAGMALQNSDEAGKEYFFSHWDPKRKLTHLIGDTMGYMEDPTDDVQTYFAKKGEKVTVILASDGGLGDRISDYEVLEAYKQAKGDAKQMEKNLFDLAMQRNGADEFFVSFGPKPGEFHLYNNDGGSDNITISVGQFKFV
jgi:serine/threonine protein phosphatase PrpC